MKRTILLASASILIIGGVVSALWVMGSASGERARFSSLEVAPRQADVFFAINTDPTSPQWLAVNRSLDNLNAKDPIRKALDEALADVNLEWDRDIAPVAGDEAFFSIPDITDVGPDGGWDAGVLLNDPGHAREVFDQLRERDDSPELTEEDYNGVAIFTTATDQSSSFNYGNGSVLALRGEPALVPPSALTCGAAGVRADGTPDPSASGGEPCADNDQICLWYGFVLAEDPVDAPYDLQACKGKASYCGSAALSPIVAPDVDGFACGNLFGHLNEGTPYAYLNDATLYDPDTLLPYSEETVPETDLLCGGFGFRADGTPDENAFGDEPCANDDEYCLWYGFVPSEDLSEPNDTAPCLGKNSYCGLLGLLPSATPSADGLACGNDYGFADDSSGGSFDFGESTPSTTAIAFVDNVLVLGGSADDVKTVIDVVQGRAESAEKNERLQEFRAHQKEDFLVWGYADLADVWTEAEDAIPSNSYSDGVDTQELFDQMRTTYDRVGFSLSSLTEGFALDLTVVHSPDFDETMAYEPTKAYDPAIAEILPADTMFYLSVFDIYNQSWLPGKGQWEDLDLGEDGSIDDILGRIRDETGVDLDSDVFALLTGELAVAGNVTNFDDPDVSAFGIADVNNDGAARDTMRRFEDFLTGEDMITADTDGDAHIWTSVEDGETVAWKVKNGRLIAGFPDDAIDDIGDGTGPSLADTDDWKRTIELLPQDKTFFGYLSITRILEEIRKTDGAEDTFDESTGGDVTLDDLEPIRSIGMSGTSREDGFGVHFVLFMKDN